MADTESGGQQCESQFAELLNRVEDLESVIAIYPKPKAPYRGYSLGGGEDWYNHFPTDMEAMEWKHGQTDFHPLPDGKNDDDEDKKSDSEDKKSDSEDNDDQDHKEKPDSNNGGMDRPGGGGGLSLFSILSGLGIFALCGLLGGMFGWLCGLFGSKKKKEKSKSGKSAVAIYAWYMGPLISGNRRNPEDLATAHRDIKYIIPKLLPPGSKVDDIDEILDDEYDDVIIDFQVYTFLEIFSPFYETIVLFIYSISRLVSTFITIATRNTCENNNIIGTHVALVTCSTFLAVHLSWDVLWSSEVCLLSMHDKPCHTFGKYAHWLLCACVISYLLREWCLVGENREKQRIVQQVYFTEACSCHFGRNGPHRSPRQIIHEH